MAFTGKVGDALWLKDSSGRKHPRVIVTPPNDEGKVVTINFTRDMYSGPEKLVRFSKKDGLQFKDNHTVRYDDTRLYSQTNLINLVENNPNLKWAYCDTKIVEKVVIGAIRSEFIAEKYQMELKRAYPALFEEYYRPDETSSL